MDISTLSEENLEIISNIFLFSGVGTKSINHILSSPQCKITQYNKGTVIFSPKKFERCIAVVLEGSILVSKENDNHRLIMSELNCGDIFGAATLFNDYSYYTTTLTAKTHVITIYFGQELVRSLLHNNPLAAENYLRYLSHRIRFLSSKIDILTAGGARKKLYDWLCKKADGKNSVTLDISLSELSDMLSIGRASLYRALDELTADGLINRKGKIIQLN